MTAVTRLTVSSRLSVKQAREGISVKRTHHHYRNSRALHD
jgi:hypothetical protein